MSPAIAVGAYFALLPAIAAGYVALRTGRLIFWRSFLRFFLINLILIALVAAAFLFHDLLGFTMIAALPFMMLATANRRLQALRASAAPSTTA